MNSENLKLTENAKEDWLAIAKKHRRKQKGLPALSKLNTNAGNVEHNISMFNKMNSPIEGPTNNPISGPFGGDVSTSASVGMCEDLEDKQTITLYYEDLYLEDVPTGRIIYGDYYTPNEYETTDVRIDYEYEVDKDTMIEFLQDLKAVQDDLDIDNVTDGEFYKKLEDNLENIVDKYMTAVLAHFERQAVKEAKENFNYDDYFGESFSSGDNKLSEKLDDNFDLSMRTLL